MKKTHQYILDTASTAGAGAALYLVDAPAWLYFVALLFGMIQRYIGIRMGNDDATRQIGQLLPHTPPAP